MSGVQSPLTRRKGYSQQDECKEYRFQPVTFIAWTRWACLLNEVRNLKYNAGRMLNLTSSHATITISYGLKKFRKEQRANKKRYSGSIRLPIARALQPSTVCYPWFSVQYQQPGEKTRVILLVQ
ncbi:hypothetical protein BGX34_005156 [Mortierella sp. NVP85]|nr:hypothetical protein BGX34_005156 [Mortierella sp. NVP85]